MAILDVTEFQVLGQDRNYRWSLAANCPPNAKQQLAIGAGSVASAAFGDSTRFVRLHADSICRVEFSNSSGSAPTASATSFRMAANTTEYFGVFPGYQVAVITST